jgi:hypothetical protein
MTVGPRREDVRMVALTALAPVGIMRRPKHDAMLQFSLSSTDYWIMRDRPDVYR